MTWYSSCGYADVNDWQKHFPAAAGSHQSPIDLTKGEYSEDLASKPLKLDYKEARECTLVNTGHSVQVNFKPSVGGGCSRELLLSPRTSVIQVVVYGSGN